MSLNYGTDSISQFNSSQELSSQLIKIAKNSLFRHTFLWYFYIRITKTPESGQQKLFYKISSINYYKIVNLFLIICKYKELKLWRII